MANFSFLFPTAFSPKDYLTPLSTLPVPDRAGGARKYQNLLHFKAFFLVFPAWSKWFSSCFPPKHQNTRIHSAEEGFFFFFKFHCMLHIKIAGFPGGLAVKKSACNAGATGEMGSIPGLGRCPGGGHGNPLQYSCLENPIDRGACWAIVHRVTKSWT